MTSEESLIASVNLKRMAYSDIRRELARSKLDLSQIIGCLVAVEGCPTKARFNQTPDPKNGQPSRVSLNVYSLSTPYQDRQPINCEGIVLMADENTIEIGIDPPVTAVGRRYSYLFNVAELVSLSPIATVSE